MIRAFRSAFASFAMLALAPTPTPFPISLPSPPPFHAPASPVPSGTPNGPALSSDQMNKIDHIAEQALADQAAPGLALAVVSGNGVVYSRGYGFSSVELQQTTRDATLYEIGSTTKQFTAAAIMLLVEDGRLALDEPIGPFFPDLPSMKSITIRELLTMTSGIPDYTDQPAFDAGTQSSTTPQAIVDTVKNLPLDFPPGTQWEYSNTNYILLGMIVEKASGEDYGSFLSQRIFRALSMNVTSYGNAAASSPDLATGYEFDGRDFKLDTPWNLDWAYATGGVVSNVLDLAIWDTALLQGKAVTLGSLREMWTAATLKDGTRVPYGFGWCIGTLDGHHEFYHTGGLPGYNGLNAAFPNDHFDVIVFSNDRNFDAGPVVRQIFEMFFPPTKDQLAAQAAGDDVALARARTVFHALQTGTLDASQLTSIAAKQLTPKLLSDARSGLSKLGAPTGFDQLDKSSFGTLTNYLYRVTFKAGSIGFSLSLDAGGKVGELTAYPM
jgi:D-alanyl-D-alanine carboxypeptidase